MRLLLKRCLSRSYWHARASGQGSRELCKLLRQEKGGLPLAAHLLETTLMPEHSLPAAAISAPITVAMRGSRRWFDGRPGAKLVAHRRELAGRRQWFPAKATRLGWRDRAGLLAGAGPYGLTRARPYRGRRRASQKRAGRNIQHLARASRARRRARLCPHRCRRAHAQTMLAEAANSRPSQACAPRSRQAPRAGKSKGCQARVRYRSAFHREITNRAAPWRWDFARCSPAGL